MANRKEFVRTCDQCGKEKRFDPDGGYYGGHPLNEWLHLSEHGGSTMLAALNKKREHDFCSWVCLMAHIGPNVKDQRTARNQP